jgi:hypothetical protein
VAQCRAPANMPEALGLIISATKTSKQTKNQSAHFRGYGWGRQAVTKPADVRSLSLGLLSACLWNLVGWWKKSRKLLVDEINQEAKEGKAATGPPLMETVTHSATLYSVPCLLFQMPSSACFLQEFQLCLRGQGFLSGCAPRGSRGLGATASHADYQPTFCSPAPSISRLSKVARISSFLV